jgi:anti-anti-sigma factor
VENLTISFDMLKVQKSEKEYIVSLFQVNRLNTLFSDSVRSQLKELLTSPGNTVVFNLYGIRFIDSAGFSTLRDSKLLAEQSGSEFKLCNLHEDVKELLPLVNMENFFKVCEKEISEEQILLEMD